MRLRLVAPTPPPWWTGAAWMLTAVLCTVFSSVTDVVPGRERFRFFLLWFWDPAFFLIGLWVLVAALRRKR